jgi:hypothetical protein
MLFSVYNNLIDLRVPGIAGIKAGTPRDCHSEMLAGNFDQLWRLDPS